MITNIHQKFYRSNATKLSEADINEIRESRGKIPNASGRMSKKFHIGAHRVYEIWEHNERLQQSLDNWNDLPPNSDEDNNKSKGNKSKTMDTLVIAGNSSVKLARSSQSESKKISREELDAYYKKENEDDKKHKADMDRLLSN
nr:12383_t:CDS:2 [Entrophospora candida]